MLLFNIKFRAMATFTTREQIVETVNKLFIYTDEQLWEQLQKEVFTGSVWLDMSSLNGPSDNFSSSAICDMWQEGFKDLDAINHLSGNYLVSIQDPASAKVKAYATASHFKASATKGQTREFVGTYDIGLIKQGEIWLINSLAYHLKYMTGNLDLE